MLNEEIEMQRQKLNKMMTTNDIDREELLRASEELDLLIVESMKGQKLNKRDEFIKKSNDLKLLMDKLRIFKEIFSIMRLIDPSNGIAYDINKNDINFKGSICYDFWNKREMCQNCISLKAFKENDTFFKVEINEDKIFLIAAFPVFIEDKCFIVEMLKDATKGMLLSDGDYIGNENALPIIEYINKIKNI